MAIQIFGTAKSQSARKARMWFKERRIPAQFLDIRERPMSAGEFESVLACITKAEGSREAAIAALTDDTAGDYAEIAYLDDSEKAAKLLEQQSLLRLPIVRNGKSAATAGLCPSVWETWR